MCDSIEDGGHRCLNHRRLARTPATDLCPAPADDRPDVDWAHDTAGASAADLYQRHPKVAAGLAITRTVAATTAEADMTTDMLAATPSNARLHGLEYRVKNPDSLARKIDTKCQANPFADPHQVAANVTDVIRYTVLADDHDRIVPTARQTVAGLRQRGWTVTSAEHSYVDGNPYKGLHIVAVHHSGEAAEVQFHSVTSQTVKDSSHHDYETARDLDAPVVERRAADTAMRAMWSAVPAPKHLGNLRTLGRCPVTVKNYR